jgi:DNA-binding phage protein
MTTPRDKSYEDSLLQSLQDPAEAAAYIDAVLETGDRAALLLALRQVASAHGMAEWRPTIILSAQRQLS